MYINIGNIRAYKNVIGKILDFYYFPIFDKLKDKKLSAKESKV